MMHKTLWAKNTAIAGANAFLGFFAGGLSWVGEIILIFGAYSWFSSGDLFLGGLGFSLICFGEGLALLKKISRAELIVLREKFVWQMGRNMLFPTLWLILFFVLDSNLFLALSIASGTKAIIRNIRLTSLTSYIFS